MVFVMVVVLFSHSVESESFEMPVSSVLGVPQARIPEWVAISYARGFF